MTLSPALSNCDGANLWDLNVLGHLVDFLLDDGLLSLHCQLSDCGLLHFDCVDDVLNVRGHTLLRLSLNSNDRHLNDLSQQVK